MNSQTQRNGIIEYLHADYGLALDASSKTQSWKGMCGNLAFPRNTGISTANFNGTRRGLNFSVVSEPGFRIALPFMKNSICQVSIYIHVYGVTNDGSARSLLMLGTDAASPSKTLQLQHGAAAGNISALAQSDSAAISVGSTYAADTEFVFGATRSTSGIALYSNGTSIGTQAVSHATPYQGAEILLIGHNLANNAFSEPFLGLVRRVAIYGIAHTATEAAAISAEWLNK